MACLEDEGEELDQPEFGGVECGDTICPVGEICCDEKCGMCYCTVVVFRTYLVILPYIANFFSLHHTCSTTLGGVCSIAGGNFCEPTICSPEEQEESEEENGWLFVTRGECMCQRLCSMCRLVFGLCVQAYCFDD